MGLIRSALRKPITILVLVAGMLFFGISAVRTIKIDIFPDMNLPVIYISHPYGGFTPDQMETYFGKQYVNLLLYVGEAYFLRRHEYGAGGGRGDLLYKPCPGEFSAG
jgi:hypothetical protein